MPEATKVRQHQWVKMVVTPIEVLPDDQGRPVVVVDPDKQGASEEDARYGCFACNASLEESFGTDCGAP